MENSLLIEKPIEPLSKPMRICARLATSRKNLTPTPPREPRSCMSPKKVYCGGRRMGTCVITRKMKVSVKVSKLMLLQSMKSRRRATQSFRPARCGIQTLLSAAPSVKFVKLER